ncbi:TonB-dependent receptor [Bacteroidia bacterium]|nr:TonB-dependent receptor [Bacteroidia bacterium]MDB4107756.1 TonB-dependent receptor [Bacteroidia bacterium]
MKHLIGSILALCLTISSFAQLGTLKGVLTDEQTGEKLVGAYVRIVGTYGAAISEVDGSFKIENIKPGTYTINISFMGYQQKIYNDIDINAGKARVLNVKMTAQTNTFETVKVVGKKKVVELDDAKSTITLNKKDIADMNVRDVQEVVAIQAGVSKSADGIQIRGARVYETSFNVDNISAQDPLAGTGFGVQVASGSIGELELITGGAGAEHDGGTAGVISTTIKEGSDKFEVAGSWQRDNLGGTPSSGWNTDIGEFSFGGKFKVKDRNFYFFNNVTLNLTDYYFGPTANQLHSSMFSNDSMWAPRQANQFTHTIKLSHELNSKTKISITNQHSLSINQNTRTLQIVGFDAILAPGFQFNRSLNLDNATTYTHHSNLTAINIQRTVNEKLVAKLSLGRLFTNLRADANGRPFRTESVDQVYDEESIVTDPIQVFNPNRNIQYVLPGPGLINNGGISSTWHDHYAREYTIKASFRYYPEEKTHQMNFGWEQKLNEYQWIDVTRPWVGAPIQINDSMSTPSISIGSSNDIWSVKPNNGGLFFSDKINYKGIIANLGVRFNYWAPGKFADDAVANPTAPVIDQVRDDYVNNTVKLFGLRYKARILPKINVSFPVTSNNVLYFNYSHSMRLPHPRFVYAGLDPEYQDRSFLSFLGNPDLNPEVNVAYEVGYKSQIGKNIGLTLAAYNNNRFDYIVSRKVIVKDQTGRPVSKTMYINQDYAKVQGAEANLIWQITSYLRSFTNLAYQLAKGKSNSARESSLQIEQNGEVPLSTENYLAWDRPWNINLGLVFAPDSNLIFYGKWMKGMQVYFSSSYQSGLRYTPQILEGYNDLGRPEYVSDLSNYLEERATPWINGDIKLTKTFANKKRKGVTLSLEARNVFNNKNSQIINTVTGRAWEPGDDLPNNQRDDRYLGPEESGTPPNNPARYQAPRQVLFGVSFRL